MESLILASQSPRRKELLSLFGIPFSVVPSSVDETEVSGSARERVLSIAKLKGYDIFYRYPRHYVLSADTLVCYEDTVLGKPSNAEDAYHMLSMLSGKTHEVYTGVCFLLPDGREFSEVERTTVEFLPITENEIKSYVSGGEPMDKAGAYAIQGQAGIFVRKISGSPSNVIGLPLDVVTRFFRIAQLPIFGNPQL